MKATIIFQKTAPYFTLGQEPELKIAMKFTECSYDEFYEWLDEHKGRLERVYDIGYSDKVILFG
jgi:hypothetical protein